MLAFLDFEASSLSKRSYPIEVAWVFEDGASEAHLIRPAPGWTEWDEGAASIHHIDRALLEREGAAHDWVARRMVETLTGHDLRASAPSWDGKWLSVLLRAAGLPRHALRLSDSDDAHLEAAKAMLRGAVPEEDLDEMAGNFAALAEIREAGHPPAHRALPDALEEWEKWLAVRASARMLAERLKAEKTAGPQAVASPDR
jgi:hypothetical protein